MKNKINKPWIILAVCCGLAAASIGISINSSGVFYTPVSESLGIMRGTYSMHMTIFSFATAITALIVPKVMKRVNYKTILYISIAAAVISTALMSSAKSIPAFYILGAVRGVSTGFFSAVPLTMIINGWFQKKHGLATSIVFGFTGIAGSVFSPVLASCIERFGWQTSYIIKAFLILILCLPAALIPFKVNAEDEGALPYGYEKTAVKAKAVNSVNTFKYSSMAFICFFIFALISSLITGITQHLPGFSESLGYSAKLGASLISAGMIGNVLSKIIIGFLSDRTGPVKACFVMIIVNIVGLIMLMSSLNTVSIIIGAFLLGCIYSVCAVGMPLLTKHFFGEKNYSKVFPVISFAGNFGSAFALSLVGYIYDFTGTYKFTFMVAVLINIIGMGLIICVGRGKKREE